jgi:DNA-binding transcriptional ArsR family regulator
MNVSHPDTSVSMVAAAIAEPARTRMLYCLMDGHARTSTELASVHLARLTQLRLLKVMAQGKHRYYSLENSGVAEALEALTVVAGGAREKFAPNTPVRLRAARTCYDHMAGALAVSLHDRFISLGWLSSRSPATGDAYDVTFEGDRAFGKLGMDVESIRTLRRRFAYGCLDWSERRPHVAGAVGAAFLQAALKKNWVIENLDSRALSLTRIGRREILSRFNLELPA